MARSRSLLLESDWCEGTPKRSCDDLKAMGLVWS